MAWPCAILLDMRAALLFLTLLPAMVRAQEVNPDLLLRQAIEEQQRGDFPSAIRDYRKVIELRPSEVEAKVNLGVALVHVRQFDQAIALYRSAMTSLEIRTEFFSTWLSLITRREISNMPENSSGFFTTRSRIESML